MNETDYSRSGPKRRQSSAPLDPEPRAVSISSRIDSTYYRNYTQKGSPNASRYRESPLFSPGQNHENHAGQGTTPSGLRIKRIQVRGENFDTLQGKFDDIIREALKRSC